MRSFSVCVRSFFIELPLPRSERRRVFEEREGCARLAANRVRARPMHVRRWFRWLLVQTVAPLAALSSSALRYLKAPHSNRHGPAPCLRALCTIPQVV